VTPPPGRYEASQDVIGAPPAVSWPRRRSRTAVVIDRKSRVRQAARACRQFAL